MHRPLQPEGWAKPAGYANGVVCARSDDLPSRARSAGTRRGGSRATISSRRSRRRCVTSSPCSPATARGRSTSPTSSGTSSTSANIVDRLPEVGKVYREIMGTEFSRDDRRAGLGPHRGSRQGRDPGDRGRAGLDLSMWRPPERIRYASEAGPVPSREEAERSRLFSPLKEGRLSLAQRTWVPAMVPWRATDDGFVSDAVIAWYERLGARSTRRDRRRGDGHSRHPERPAAAHRRRPLHREAETARRRCEASQRRPDAAVHPDHRFSGHPAPPRAREIFRALPAGDRRSPARGQRGERSGGARTPVRARRGRLEAGAFAARVRIPYTGVSGAHHGRGTAAYSRLPTVAAAFIRCRRDAR